ncbi:Metallo-hydrolase/oxidoreductase [Xylariaceae sp. FL0255]|nr:Metallo-hydrolase/oxidoreductase [Xylariaceae sp. FL0255]
MRPFQQILRSTFRRPPSMTKSTKVASVGVSSLAVAAYAVTVAAPKSVADKTKDHHVKNGRGETVKFRNPHPSYIAPTLPLLFTMALKNWFGIEAWPKPRLSDKLVKVVKPQFLTTRTACSELRATWLGHACYYVEYPSGLRVLFDPVFEDCCSPVSGSGFKRFTEKPCDIGDIPFVDAVIISHSHYDHLSYPSVLEVQKHHPNAHFFVPLGLEKWFKESGVSQVTEMDWWDEAEVSIVPTKNPSSATETEKPIRATFSCLPSQHSSGRTAFDRDRTLWASWAVRSGTPEKTVWFGGDTGYRSVPKVPAGVDDRSAEYQHLPICPQFKEIGEHLNSIDLGLIPIGAYDPRYLFSGVHANPFDSVEIFRDTRCKRAMGIHWGTWVLTREDPLEPPKMLKEALRRRGMPETDVFDVCDIGESREF